MSTTPPGLCSSRRRLPFPPPAVLAAFADPARLAAWWGPDGFTNTFAVCEFKPQGRWSFIMHGHDGTNYPNECLFLETGPDRVVIRHTCFPFFTLTITLAAAGGQTDLQWDQLFDDPAFLAAHADFLAACNAQNLDRLHRVLSRTG